MLALSGLQYPIYNHCAHVTRSDIAKARCSHLRRIMSSFLPFSLRRILVPNVVAHVQLHRVRFVAHVADAVRL